MNKNTISPALDSDRDESVETPSPSVLNCNRKLNWIKKNADTFSLFEDGYFEETITTSNSLIRKDEILKTVTSIYDGSKVSMNNVKQQLKNPKQVVDETKAGLLSGVEKAGVKYLDLTFREKRVHRVLLDLINGAIKEKSFVQDSRKYGIELINDVVKDPVFQRETKKSSLLIVRHDDVKRASVDLLKELVHHPTSKSCVTSMMKDTMLTTPAKEVAIKQLGNAVMLAVQKKETNKHLGKLFNTIAAQSEFQEEAKASLLYQNLYDWVKNLNQPKVQELTDDSLWEESIFSLFRLKINMEE